ncbi:MAG: hypothetical protein J7L32_06280 [Thermoplasmata archaeon]|nr:hypothetical protein [Thermoplasmata archaeon]
MEKILFTLKFYPMREVELAQVLKEHGFTPLAVGFSRRWSTFAKHSGNFHKVYDFTEFLQKQGDTTSNITTKEIERLERWEHLYGIPNLELFIAGDRTMRLFSWERNLRLLDNLFVFWEQILRTEAPDTIVGELSSAPDLIAWSMSKKLGIRYLCPMHSRLWKDRFALSDIAGQWEGLEKTYQKVKIEGLADQDREEAWKFLNGFLNGEPEPSYMRYVAAKTNPRKIIQRLFRLSNKLSSYHVDKKLAVDYPVSFSIKILDDLRSISRRALAKTKLIRIFDKPEVGERFILFPLHYQPEATTMVFAPFYENQLAVAENIAKSIPAGYRLYVKEHKAMWGRRPFWFYKHLRQLPSVKLIQPEFNIHDLIKSCAAVVVLTNTTGLEALLHGKPVVVLGNIFYEIFRPAHKVYSFNELPYVLQEVVRASTTEQTEILRIVHSLLSSTYPGNFDDPKRCPNTYSRINAEKILRSIIQVLRHD